jgi:hypothetical protein
MLLTYAIGAAESIVFLASFHLGKPEFAGGWLAFKLATKWKAWQHIVQPSATSHEALSWSEREAIATKTTTRFLAGTACNIVAALFGAYVVKCLLGFRS